MHFSNYCVDAGWQGCKAIWAKPSLSLCFASGHKSWVSSVAGLLLHWKWIQTPINILHKQSCFYRIVITIINHVSVAKGEFCFVFFSHTCSILGWRTEGQLEQTTWSARVHKEISEDYFCNFRVNALFIILWIAEAKSGKDLRSLAEIACFEEDEKEDDEEKEILFQLFEYIHVSQQSLSQQGFRLALTLRIWLPTIISHWRAFLDSLYVNYRLTP